MTTLTSFIQRLAAQLAIISFLAFLAACSSEQGRQEITERQGRGGSPGGVQSKVSKKCEDKEILNLSSLMNEIKKEANSDQLARTYLYDAKTYSTSSVLPTDLNSSEDQRPVQLLLNNIGLGFEVGTLADLSSAFDVLKVTSQDCDTLTLKNKVDSEEGDALLSYTVLKDLSSERRLVVQNQKNEETIVIELENSTSIKIIQFARRTSVICEKASEQVLMSTYMLEWADRTDTAIQISTHLFDFVKEHLKDDSLLSQPEKKKKAQRGSATSEQSISMTLLWTLQNKILDEESALKEIACE